MNIKKYYFYHCHASGREDIKSFKRRRMSARRLPCIERALEQKKLRGREKCAMHYYKHYTRIITSGFVSQLGETKS